MSIHGEPWVQDGELAVQDKPIRRRANNPNVVPVSSPRSSAPQAAPCDVTDDG
jgi:hypothetical protein